MYYMLSTDKILMYVIANTSKSDLEYFNNDMKIDFYTEKIYQFIINTTPVDLLNKVEQIIFHSKSSYTSTVFTFDYNKVIKTNPKSGLNENHMNNLFSNYWSFKENINYSKNFKLEKDYDIVFFNTKCLSIEILKIKDIILKKQSVEVLDSGKLLSDPKKYISTYICLNELYENNYGMDYNLVNFDIIQKPLLRFLNKKLYKHFASNKLEFSKVFILEEEDIAFKRLFPQLYPIYGDNIIIHDFSISKIKEFNKNVYWLKNFQELPYKEQVSLLKLFNTHSFSKKLIIVSSKVMQEETLVTNTFKENIYKLHANLKNIDNISQLFFYMLNEKGSITTNDLTIDHINKNNFALIFDGINTFSELDNIVKSLDPGFNFMDINHWQKFLEKTKRYSHEIDGKLRDKEEKQKLNYEFQFINEKNGTFRIIYSGKHVVLRDMKLDGLVYLQGILRYGNRPNGIDCSDLINLNVSLKNISSSEKAEIQSVRDEFDDNGSIILDSRRIELTDLKSVVNIRKKINILERSKNDYEHEISAIEDIDDELFKLKKELRRVLNIHGRIKKESTQLVKDFRKVSNAIERAYKHILVSNKDFYEYLNISVKLVKGKYSYKYLPVEQVEWLLD